jgi:hypothetical protein
MHLANVLRQLRRLPEVVRIARLKSGRSVSSRPRSLSDLGNRSEK